MKNRRILALLLAGSLTLGSVPVWGAEENGQLADIPVQTEESDGKVDSEELRTRENEGQQSSEEEQQETDSEPEADLTDETQNEENGSKTEAVTEDQKDEEISPTESLDASEDLAEEEQNSGNTEVPSLEKSGGIEENVDSENVEGVQETIDSETADIQEEGSTETLQADSAVTEEGIVIAEAFPDERIRNELSNLLVDPDSLDAVGDDGILDAKEISLIDSFEFNWMYNTSSEPLNLEGLQYLTELRSLNLWPGVQVINTEVIGQIAANGKLEYLRVADAGLTNADFIKDATSIHQLELFNNQLENLNFLAEADWFSILDVSNNKLTDISGIRNVIIVDGFLNLSNNQIEDISPLYSARTYQDLNLSGNRIKDISVLSNNQVENLYLNNNQIQDITPLTQIESYNGKYMRFNLANNQIDKLPENWRNLLAIKELDLRNNNLTSIKALLPRYQDKVDASVELITWISGNEGLTKEAIFQDIYDTSPRSVMVGNTLELNSGYQTETGPGSFEELLDDISFQTADPNIAEIIDGNRVLAKAPGQTTIIAVMNDVQVEIPLEVTGSIEPTTVVASEIPEIQAVFDGGCVTWDDEGSLWSYVGTEGELIAKNVVSYVPDVVCDINYTMEWANYYILNENNDLLYYSKESPDDPFEKTLLYQNVNTYTVDQEGRLWIVLTNDHILYHAYTGDKLAENVKNYEYFMPDGEYFAFTTDDKIICDTGVIAENIAEGFIHNQEQVVYRIGSSLYVYTRWNGDQLIADNVSQMIDSTRFVNLQGDVMGWYDGPSGMGVEVLDERSAYPVIASCSIGNRSWWLDSRNILWTSNADAPVAENVEKIQWLGDDSWCYMAGNRLVDLETGEVKENIEAVTPFYYLGTDNIVYEMRDGVSGDVNTVLSDVVRISQPEDETHQITYTYCYMVRQDGTVWKYDSQSGTQAVPVHIEMKVLATGDIDGNGKVQVSDLLSVLHEISGSITLGEGPAAAADIDGDGQVSVRDLLRILHYISGASEEL